MRTKSKICIFCLRKFESSSGIQSCQDRGFWLYLVTLISLKLSILLVLPLTQGLSTAAQALGRAAASKFKAE